MNQREMNFKEYSQEWFEDGQIDEVAFCENFLQRMPLKCINGIFFSYDGMLPDSEVEKEIYRMVKPVLTKGISKKVKQLLEVLKLEAYSEELPVQMDRIHVNNGTYFLNGDFTEKKEFCLNRFVKREGYPNVQAFQKVYNKAEALIMEYNEELRAWKNQTEQKKENPLEQPKKASVLEKLHRYQQEGRQQPKRSVKKKSMDRER